MADQEYSTSGMVALVPSDEHLAALTVPDGDPPEQLHLTLAFLGDAVDTWPEGTADAVRERMAALAGAGGVEAAAFAHALFNPDDPERDPCAVYLVNGDFALRDAVLAELSAALGDAMPEQFPTFIPHVTAGYGLAVESLSYTGPVRFDRLRVAIGNDHTDYPLETNMANTEQGGVPVSLVVVVEGMETRDGRFIEPGALTHAALPLPILAQTRNPDGGSGHDGAEIIGRMDTLRRVPGPELTSRQTGQPFPEGTFVWVADGEIGAEYDATGLVQRGYLTGNSVDLVDVTVELVWPDTSDQEDEDFFIVEPEQVRLTSGQIAATTLVPIGAFGEACILLGGQPVVPADDLDRSLVAAAWRSADIGDDTCLPCALHAAADTRYPSITASGENDLPPVDAFADPELDAPTALRRDGDRVYGHLALWGTCHIGVVGQCLTPPRSSTGYAYFRTGAVAAWNGTDTVEVPTGVLTVGTGHAGEKLGARATADHYDNTGTAVADVAAGEDEHGIWVAGVLRPTAPEHRVSELLAAPLSGDWRRIGGNLELVAALAVNVPGFPVPRVRVASGAPQALVAAGVLPPEPQASPDAADAVADRVVARLAEMYGLTPLAEARATAGFESELTKRRKVALARLSRANLSARHRAVVERLRAVSGA